MRDSLYEYFDGIRDEDLIVHGLESMALCAAIHMASQRAGANRGEDVRGLLSRWAQQARHDRPLAEVRRMQPLLEELLAEFTGGRLDALTPDEATLLFAASALLKLLPSTPYYDSVRERLEPHQAALGKFVGGHPPDPALATLSDRWLIMCPRDLTLSPQREVKKLSRIPIQFIGTVLTVPTRAKFIGSIPEKAMLVVEDGACCIEGFVQGFVATRGDCLVQENIGGVAISAEGDIRARKLIDRARVVAKWGRVHCQETASPALVFAGRSVTVEGDATRGQFRAHEVRIQGRALGAVIAVSGHAEASRFVHGDRYETTIILRHGFDATAYGEEIDLNARRRLARAARVRQRQRTVHSLIQAMAAEVEQDAHTVLVYLAIGDDGMSRIQDLEAAQGRLAALNRVIMGLHQLSSEVEENAYSDPWERSAETVADSVDDGLAAIISELQGIEPGEAGSGTAATELNQLQHFRTQMQQLRSNRLFVVSLLAEWRSRLQHWLTERDGLRLRIQQAHREMESGLQLLGRHPDSAKPASSVARLREVMADDALLARNRDLQMRANAQFVKLMRRNINSRLNRLRDLRLEAGSLRTEFEQIQEELHATMRLRAVDDGGEVHAPTVTGRFDAGVRLATNELALEADDAPDTVLLTLAKPREEVTTFKRIDTGIVEVE